METFLNILLQIFSTALVLSVLIFVHELGHFLAARACKIKVNEFALGMGPKILKWQGKETLYSVRLFPIGGFCAMEGEDEESENPGAIGKKPVWQRIIVVSAGAITNLVIGFVITMVIVLTSTALPSHVVADFTDESLSVQSGLQAEDEIIKINNKRINVYDDMTTAFSQMYNKTTANLTVRRNGEIVELFDVQFPVFEVSEDLSILDIDFYVHREEKTVGVIMKHTFFRTLSYVTLVYDTLIDLITGNISIKYMSGPIGMSDIVVQAVKSGLQPILFLIALLSINLAVMNLLPFPALDGGRLVFMIIELFRGKPINQKYEGLVHLAGIVILFAFMIFISIKDIIFIGR